MVARKTAVNGEAGEAGAKFTWEGANDYKLLLLTQGRYCKPAEYEQLSTAFPGTTIGSIRNRISGLRVKQRDLYESLGWEVPEGGAGHGKDKGMAKGKRAATDDLSEAGTPAKKARATPKATPKKEQKDVVKEEEIEEESGGLRSDLEEET